MANSAPGKVLFISHEASRSGAPIVLLHLLKWIKKNTNLRFEILLLADGPLKADFEQLGETFLLNDIIGQHSYSGRIRKKLLGTTVDHRHKKAAGYFSKRGYSLIYGNTITSLPWLKIFKESHAIKTLCCVHELSYVLNYFYPTAYLLENLNLMDRIIAVSNAVKENLIDNCDVQPEKIELQYEFIDTDVTIAGTTVKKADLGLIPGEFIVGMGGTPEWRKGTDLVIPLTIKLKELFPAFKFRLVWLGAGKENEFVKQLLYDARKCGIEDRLTFIDSNPDPFDFISLFDVFVLLSREDPFPLIALEAAFMKKPIIAFENGGGMQELVVQGAGLLAPYLDISEVAKHIYKLSQNKTLASEMAGKANELVISNYTSAVISPAIYGIIKELIDPVREISAGMDLRAEL